MIGETVGHYEVEARLGGGGMGVVYRARDKKLGRAVALKFLSSHLVASAKAKERFIAEARAASAQVLARFTEGHATGDLVAARAILAELR